MKRVLVLASDKRLLCAGELLAEAGFSVDIIKGIEDNFDDITKNVDYDCVLLPIRGTTDGTVELLDGKMDLDYFFCSLPDRTVVISGIKTAYEVDTFPGYFCFQEDETFVAANSKLTAEGVLSMLLTNTPDSIYAYDIDLIGYGNIGKTIYSLLSMLGLKVKRIDKKSADGIVRIEEWKKKEPGDIIINTAPATVIDETDVESFHKTVTILDIASKGIGVSESAKKHENINYFAAPPLPGMITPKGAGRVLAELVCRKIS